MRCKEGVQGSYVRAYVRPSVRTYGRTYMRTYVRRCVCTYVRTYVRAYARMYVRTYHMLQPRVDESGLFANYFLVVATPSIAEDWGMLLSLCAGEFETNGTLTVGAVCSKFVQVHTELGPKSFARSPTSRQRCVESASRSHQLGPRGPK